MLPVICGGSLAQQYVASVKNSFLFKNFVTMRLTENQRLNPGQERYSNFLKKVATGLLNDPEDRVQIPKDICLPSREELINFVFPDKILQDPINNWRDLSGRAILCPINADVFNYNYTIMVYIYIRIFKIYFRIVSTARNIILKEQLQLSKKKLTKN